MFFSGLATDTPSTERRGHVGEVAATSSHANNEIVGVVVGDRLAAPAAQPYRGNVAEADPAVEAAKATFEALPEAERKGLQDALVWTGDYNSVINGAFGRRTYDAILAWRTRENRPGETLDARARAGILAAAEAARRAAEMAKHGTREEQSGKFLPPPGWKGHLVTAADAAPAPKKRA